MCKLNNEGWSTVKFKFFYTSTCIIYNFIERMYIFNNQFHNVETVKSVLERYGESVIKKG